VDFGPHLLLATLEGTVTAAVLMLTALGLSLVFGVMRIVNVAHGEFYMLGAVLAWWITSQVGGHPALGFAVALIGVSVLEYMDLVNTTDAFPPYRGSQLIYVENILGGEEILPDTRRMSPYESAGYRSVLIYKRAPSVASLSDPTILTFATCVVRVRRGSSTTIASKCVAVSIRFFDL